MTDNSYENWNMATDSAIEEDIGRYVKKVRQQQKKTQKELADAANISRSTLSLLERGETGTLKTLIQVLRVLNKLQVLQGFEYKETVSPLALAKLQHKTVERVKHSQKKKNLSNTQKSDW